MGKSSNRGKYYDEKRESMSEEFTKLQNLIKEGKAELLLKKSWRRNDIFGLWLHWHCKEKPSLINFYGKSFILYRLLIWDWLWIPLSIILAVKISWLFLLCLLTPFTIVSLVGPIGHGFIIYDAQNDEDLFDDLWQNQAISIASVKKHESMVHKNGVPDIMIVPHKHNWREEIDGNEF